MRRRWCERSALSSAFSRPLVGRPLGHLSSRKAGIVRPRSGLLQKPCCTQGWPWDSQAAQPALASRASMRSSSMKRCAGRPQRKSSLEQLRRFEIIKAKRELGIFFCSRVLELICALAQGSCRGAPPAGGEFGCCAPALQCAPWLARDLCR